MALTAIALLKADPRRIGGILVKARPGPVRDLWTEALGSARRLPASADAEGLDAGLDLAATLAAGRPVTRPGLIAEIGGGVLLVPMAERLAPSLAARLASARDDDGPVLVLFDEAEGEADETVSAALADRVAIHLDLDAIRLPMAGLLSGQVPVGAPTQAEPGAAVSDADAAASLANAALALGIASIRAPLHALRLAWAHARLGGRTLLAAADLEIAAALVLGPRATRLPPTDDAPDDAPDPSPDEDEPQQDQRDSPPPDGDNDQDRPSEPPSGTDDLVMDAARTSLPPGLLDALAAGAMPKAAGGGKSGAKLRSLTSGRPAGVRAGMPGRGARLAIIDTIKTAAPWQSLRPRRADGRMSIHRDDLRIRRFVARAESTTIFAVDASGSAALARLAEAKGAVEQLLAQAYVKRAEVALVAFRGDGAEITLPPTRSLARAKRQLAALAGGGGTPMAAGIDLARRLGEQERARGRTPLVVVLTDGRANVGGTTTLSPQAAALASARMFAASGIASVFIDCSARPRPEGGALAAAMAARYVALPRLDARMVVAAVSGMTG